MEVENGSSSVTRMANGEGHGSRPKSRRKPLAGIQKFNVSKAPKIGILTPEQLSAFLDVVDTKFIPFFTINAFTGLRRAEVERLDWSEIKLDRRLIELPPAKSKNKRRKLVEIPENL